MLFALVFASELRAAQGPYEPNDTLASAVGPLAGGQPYSGAVEVQGDIDYFYFYLTAPGETKVTLTLRNLGGGADVANVDAMVLDSSSTPVGGLSYINRGQEKTATLTLRPQKYFIEVRSSEGFGDSYTFTVGGELGPYATIASRCAKATVSTARARVRLTRAQAKLQRTTARLRRSRYGTDEAKAAARTAYRKARARVTAAKKALRAAKASQKPWCLIPQ
jgi:hypothetical protein